MLQEPWSETKIVHAAAFKSTLAKIEETIPLIVLAETRDEYEQANKVRTACGSRGNVTFVVLENQGPGHQLAKEVLMVGKSGPSKAKAVIIYIYIYIYRRSSP